ncbi:hypothetical protein PN925_003966 [Morganella morganii]|uniref:Uncharacterized protein n=1 Tax=Morganella morganii TaxID=582 RepID=A0AAI9HVW8_MORMO|nr:hypothetical protein [Morganella morganii]
MSLVYVWGAFFIPGIIVYFPEVKNSHFTGRAGKQFTGLCRSVFCEKNISDTLIVFGFRVSEGPEVTGIYDGYSFTAPPDGLFCL